MRTPSVNIVEVAPRDGLQNESVHVDTATKIQLVERAAAAGITRVEVTSFVNPKRVPQMADADEVVAGLATQEGVSHIGLAMNERGVHRAVAAGVDEINFVVVTTDTFNRANQGVSTFESIAILSAMTTIVREHGLLTSVTVAASFGCPYEGEVEIARLLEVVERVVATEPDEIALADTIGVAAPTDVAARVGAVREVIGDTPLRCHFHNTPQHRPCQRIRGCRGRCRVVGRQRWRRWRLPPLRLMPPATSQPKTSCTCSTGWASSPASTSRR